MKRNPPSAPRGGTDIRVCRRRAVAGAVVCCAGFLAAATTQAGTLRTWPTAVVVDDSIRVADLCEMREFDTDAYARVREIVVAEAPPPGGSKRVHLLELRKALARSGVNLATVLIQGASHCAVSRPAAAVPSAGESPKGPAPGETASREEPDTRTLRQAVESFFQSELDRVGGTVRVQFGRTSQPVLDLSGPEFDFTVRRRSGRTLGLVSIDVAVLRDGKTIQAVPMVVNVSFTKPVVMARRSINAKAAIRPEDVQLVEMTFHQVDRRSLSDPREVVGQRARRFIAAGEMIQARNLERVPLIHRGQIVDVHTRVGGVKIVSAAKALQSGGFGDVIELRAAGHKRSTVTGVVTGPRRVEIGGLPPYRAGHDIHVAAGGR